MPTIKVLSIWQPYAQLAVLGFKRNETRGTPPPSTLAVGERFAIASTKQIKCEQRLYAERRVMLEECKRSGLPHWRELPRGCIIGTAVLGKPVEIDRHLKCGIDEREFLFGDWRIGRWAWPLVDPILLSEPIPVRGQQGVWTYYGALPSQD